MITLFSIIDRFVDLDVEMQPFPHPNDALDENLVAIGPLVSEILMFKSVNTRTHGWTPARLVYYKLTMRLRLR